MKHWDDDDRAEYELALEEAWATGGNDAERTTRFIQIVEDAKCSGRRWAADVIASSLRDGMWTRLKRFHRDQNRRQVTFGGTKSSVSALAGVRKQTTSGVEFVQMDLWGMTRTELAQKVQETEDIAYAARRNRWVFARLIELCDQVPEAETAGAAADSLGIDRNHYLAA